MSRRSKKQQLKKAVSTTGCKEPSIAPAAGRQDARPPISGVYARIGAAANGLGRELPWSKWEIAGLCALLVVLVFSVFGQTVAHGFVNFDDDQYVYGNRIVSRGFSLEGIRWAFVYGKIGHWHPLTWMTHMLDCQFFGMRAGGHHLTNVVLHATAVVLLFLVLFQMTGAAWRSVFVAGTWAVHPLRVESVAWISERKDVLSAVFFMLALWAYIRCLRRPSKWSHPLVAVFFTFGLLSKNMLVTFPFVLLLLDYWPLGRLNHSSQIPRLLKEKIPLFALSALSCAITFLVPEKIPAGGCMPFWLRVQNALVSCCIYLRQTVWPSGLAAYYPNPSQSFAFLEVAGSLALLCLLSCAAVGLRKRHPALLVGWLWFMVMLVPVLGFVQISSYAHADRYTYLPQIGLCIAGTWVIADWIGGRYRRKVLGGLAAVILCILPVAASIQTSYWSNSITLWNHTLECTGDNFLAHNSLGIALFMQGQTEEAIDQYREALQINPAYSRAINNLGNALLKQARTEEAVNQFREAIQLNSDYAEAHFDLGNALFQQGRMVEAITQFREALQYDPDYADDHYNLGIALLQQGRTEEAIAQFREALRINPDAADVHNNLGIALFQQRRTEEAIAQFREALRINPAFNDARINLRKALLQQGEESTERQALPVGVPR